MREVTINTKMGTLAISGSYNKLILVHNIDDNTTHTLVIKKFLIGGYGVVEDDFIKNNIRAMGKSMKGRIFGDRSVAPEVMKSLNYIIDALSSDNSLDEEIKPKILEALLKEVQLVDTTFNANVSAIRGLLGGGIIGFMLGRRFR